MMFSLILRAATRLLVPLMLLYSVFLFVRGHHETGGGFSAGLVAAGAFALYALAYGSRHARQTLRVEPATLIGVGLGLSLLSGVLPLFAGKRFLTGLWLTLKLSAETSISLGTPLLFDAGVYLLVLGTVLIIILPLEDAHTALFPPT